MNTEKNSLVTTIIIYIIKSIKYSYTVVNLLDVFSHLVIKSILVAYYNVLVQTHRLGKFHVLSGHLKLRCFRLFK